MYARTYTQTQKQKEKHVVGVYMFMPTQASTPELVQDKSYTGTGHVQCLMDDGVRHFSTNFGT